jgi:hypothetical protein
MNRSLMLVLAAIGAAAGAAPVRPAFAQQQQPATDPQVQALEKQVQELESREQVPFEVESSYPRIPQDSGPSPFTPSGTTLMLGGGITGFTASRARDVTETGGGWNARLVVGTRSVLSAEIGYVGSAQSVDATGLDGDAFLLGNGGEVAARIGWPRSAVQPYLLAGAGFTHYSLVNDDFNTSSVESSDNLVHFPLGAGIAVRAGNVLLDARGVFRPSVEGDLFAEDENDMHTWSGSLNAGWEF